MIKIVIKFITFFALFGCISNQICYASPDNNCQANGCYIQLAQNGQDENSFIKKNQEAVKSSTNSALFTVYRIKCLNTNGKNGLVACNKALSIKSSDPALRRRKSVITAQLKPKRPPVVARQTTPQRPKPIRVVKPKATKSASKPVKKAKVTQINADTLRKANLAKKQAKQTVVKIQKLLIKLGFNVSTADGIAGKNTRKAINNFIKVSNSKVSPKTTKSLLAELQKANKSYQKANILYSSAKEHQKRTELEEALMKIEDGLKLTPWHTSLAALKTQIKAEVKGIKDAEQKVLARQIALQQEKKEEALRLEEEKRRISQQKSLFAEEEKKELERLNTIKIAEQKREEARIEILKATEKKKEVERLASIRKIEEKRLLEQQQAAMNKEKQLKMIREYTAEAKNELFAKNFTLAIQSVDKGLLLSPKDQQMMTLKKHIISTQKQYQISEQLKQIATKAQGLIHNNKHEKAILLINDGLLINPNSQTLLSLKETLLTEKAQATRLLSLLAQSKRLFEDRSFEDVIKITNNGLSIDPNHLELLKIKQKAVDEQEKIMIQISLRKQKISNFLALIQGKQKELLSIQKKISSEKRLLLIEAQKTLNKHWVIQSSQ